MYSMKQACEQTGMNYEALKFYCNAGLVPNVKRDGNNRRVFDNRDVEWIKALGCLKRCGLSIAEMKRYTQLCMESEDSIPERKRLLEEKREALLEQLQAIKDSIAYIDRKQAFYDGVLAGTVEYYSNLVSVDRAGGDAADGAGEGAGDAGECPFAAEVAGKARPEA